MYRAINLTLNVNMYNVYIPLFMYRAINLTLKCEHVQCTYYNYLIRIQIFVCPP